MEVALKLAYEFTRRTKKNSRPRFLSLEGAYHGDTVGAVALGHVDLFHKAYSGLLFKTDKVMAPYCYRCPFNRAKPERADARDYRKCNWECLGRLERRFAGRKRLGEPYAAFVFEPLMQGAAGMIPQPTGWLRRVAEIARSAGTLLIADEVMTGFGRTGMAIHESGGNADAGRNAKWIRLFASAAEGVQPDFMAIAKGLTGGYLPMAATLTTQAVFDAFLGEHHEFKTFFHGHSYTANQVGAAVGLASLDLLQTPASVNSRARLEDGMRRGLHSLWDLPQVGDIRQAGLVAGIELVRNWRNAGAFRPARPSRHPGLRADGQTGCAHAPNWKRHRADAALLHHRGRTGNHDSRVATRYPVAGLTGAGRRKKFFDGGADRNRTCDLLIANETLCQLSYDPIPSTVRRHSIDILAGINQLRTAENVTVNGQPPSRRPDPARSCLRGQAAAVVPRRWTSPLLAPHTPYPCKPESARRPQRSSPRHRPR